ncbi:MAG: formimidoylglutamate deiminase [Reyranellaceae bacterium]
MASKLHLETALMPDGWRHDVVVGIDHGVIVSVEDPGDGAAERVSGVTLPGLPNLHSHAFQRAMAGLTERRRGDATDSFWTWREAMYHFVDRLDPDDLEAIAAFAYMEMLEAGFTQVAEFHYLHHQPDGRPYDAVNEMSQRIVAAADAVGIGLTLLPVLYRQGGFLGKPAGPAQRRFLCDRDAYARLMEAPVPGGTIGIAPHSLRAVTLDDLRWAAVTWPDRPAHIHVAEQEREVADCLAAHDKRPVDLLLDTIDGDASRWCLVHATHTSTGELKRMSDSKAVAGLCPITEANLGDGLFDAPTFLAQGGRVGVGSDSLIRISAADELRTLEYGQRLVHRQRNVLAEPTRSSGRRLFDAALAGGAQATDRTMLGGIAIGKRADLIVLDRSHPSLAAARDDSLLDAWLFAADSSAIKTVYCRGVAAVQDGRHFARDRVGRRYRKTVAALA